MDKNNSPHLKRREEENQRRREERRREDEEERRRETTEMEEERREMDRELRRELEEERRQQREEMMNIFRLRQRTLPIRPTTSLNQIVSLFAQKFPFLTFEQEGLNYIFTLLTPQTEDDVEIFQQRIKDIFSELVPLSTIVVTIRMNVLTSYGTTTIERPILHFIRENSIQITNNETIFWDYYEEDRCSVLSAEILVGFEIILRDKEQGNRNTADGFGFPLCLLPQYQSFVPFVSSAQIYSINDVFLSHQSNCFLHSLECLGVEQETLDQMKILLKDNKVSNKKIKELCERFQITVRIIVEYPKKQIVKKKPYKVVIFDFDKTEEKSKTFTLGCIRIKAITHFYPHEVFQRKDIIQTFEKCELTFPKQTKQISMGSLIWFLYENDCFTFLPHRLEPQRTLGFPPLTLIDLNVFETRQCKFEEKKQKTNFLIVFADFECFTCYEEHIPFCICWQFEGNPKKYSFYEIKCGEHFVNAMINVAKREKKDIVCYFHNLGYDGRFLVYGIVTKIIMKGKKIYSMVIKAGKNCVIFKDSLALIPSALSNFPSMFGIEQVGPKELFPYHYYNEETFNRGVIEDVGMDEKPQWKPHQFDQFKRNLETLNLIEEDGKHFNAKEYCLYYCHRDVEILKEGFKCFRQQMKEQFNLECCDYLTISSMAYAYFFREAFSNEYIFEYTGFLREWIRAANVGGRCMTKQNKKWECNDPIVDFDACSLYPSAMNRLLIPTGNPRKLRKEECNVEYLMNHLMEEQQENPTEERFISCFIVKIRILKVGVEKDFPIVYERDEKIRTLHYTNKDGSIMTCDHIYFEDLIEYQRVEVEIIEGICWEGKKSRKLMEKIKYVYDKRLELKQKKNKAENCYKLMMNSSYGKTIQKAIESDVKIVKGIEKYHKTIAKNYNLIKSTHKLHDDYWLIKKWPSRDDLWTPTIIGILILSMSKRIMKEVFSCADDLGIEIFYQDTDSIHIRKNDVPALSEWFQEKYGRSLIGNQMGQFHSDFPPLNGKESWAIRSIFCGKKCYLDVLTNENGEIGYHYRLKGVPQESIIAKCEEKGWTLEELYVKLLNGEEIEFNLLAGKPSFEFTQDFRVINRHEFVRKIRF